MTMQIPLVVALWKDAQYGGTKRTIVDDVPDLADWSFDDMASAIGVHHGPDFASWAFPPFQYPAMMVPAMQGDVIDAVLSLGLESRRHWWPKLATPTRHCC